MAHPYLALRPTRNGRVSHYAVAGSKNPLPLGMGSVNAVDDSTQNEETSSADMTKSV